MNSIHIHTEQQRNKTLSLPHVRDVLCWLLVVQEIRLLVIGWKLIVFVTFFGSSCTWHKPPHIGIYVNKIEKTPREKKQIIAN